MSDPAATNLGSHVSRLRNWLSLLGVLVSTSALFAFILLFAVDAFAEHANPYIGLLAYVVTPVFLIGGLALVLLGYLLQSRKIRRDEAFVLHVDLSRKRDRKLMTTFIFGSLSFLLLTAFGSYETYHLIETNSFCGEACHRPMEPEYKAYQHSAHAQVHCVSCHVGPGTRAFIRTKLNGMKQLYSQMREDYPKPIRILNPNLRLAQETCQTCHWPKKHFGNLPKTYRHFLADETNSPFTVQMVLKVGGSDPVHGAVEGIHSHMNVANKIEFIHLDPERLSIPWVRVTDANGKVTEFRTEEFKDDVSQHVIRTMDCMDCHNRPSHKLLSPNAAVDEAMAMNRIDTTIPWAKKNVVTALAAAYSTKEEALEKIGESLSAAYPNEKRVAGLIAEARRIYGNYFYPEMKADWRAHPDQIGHKDTNGCFRCHDGKHFAGDGKTTIKASDCNACHLILAQGSGAELEKVDPKGLPFVHIDSEYSDSNCAECHNGQMQEEVKEEPEAESKEEPKVEPKVAPKVEPKVEAKAEPK